MKATITRSEISGRIAAPVSKSSMQRALAAALIRKGRSVLHNPGSSDDDKAALQIIKDLGATVEEGGEKLIIESSGVQPVVSQLNCGESGLSARMFTPIAALSSFPVTITGIGTLLRRPMNFFDEVLPKLKVECRSTDGKLPLQIKGPLHPADIAIDGSLSSQYLTGLLFAYAAAGAAATITVNNLSSKPYIDLSIEVLTNFGLTAPVQDNYRSFSFSAAETQPKNGVLEYDVEGDWSGAAFMLVAGAIAGDVHLRGLNVYSRQADKAVLGVLSECGAVVSISEDHITIGRNKLRPFQFNASNCPDLFPPLVALASHCNGTSVIEGVHRLRHKESDRASSLMQEFSSMGVHIELQGDLMIIRPGAVMPSRVLHSHDDHRIAMAIAVAALGMTEPVEINGAEAVSKSYPDFWKDLRCVGAEVSLTDN